MTAVEMSNTFDIKLNSYLKQHGYGNQQGDLDITINEYEKSLYLTNAQYEIVRNLYEGKRTVYNEQGESFEGSESIRRILAELVNTYTLNSSTSPNPFIVSPNSVTDDATSYLVKIPNKDTMWYIIYEQVELQDDACDITRVVDVVPTKYEELRNFLQNPFKRPNQNRVLRLDVDKESVELVTSYQSISSYRLRYLSKPSPIITANLPLDISIEGLQNTNQCELNTVIHDLIVDMAVQLAIQTKGLGRTEEQAQDKNS
ncbi:MAG: hypothetical protein J6N78_05180 [Clostridia bacterium]|nr:hypothetical protein [Clostridia bacterium]